MKTLLRFLSLVLVIGVSSSFCLVSSDVLKNKKTIFEHLQQDEHLNITLESNYKAFLKNKKTNDYQPAKLRIARPDGSEETWEIEIRARGNMRRTVCDIPPIKMKFSEEQLRERGLDKRSTLKMVIICRNSGSYEQMVLREYLTYRLYNIITNHSFQVQLAKIKYVNTDGKSDGFNESFAFFIEHPKNLADRTEAELLEGCHFSSALMNTDAGERFAMFQYMVGNTDWYYFNSHNVEVCGMPGTSDLVPLPYDFDYAGLVRTPYAVPLDKLNLSTVSERYYQGYCRSKEETMETIQLFLDKKEEIMKMAVEFPYFDKYSKKYVRKYLGNFFKTIENKKGIKRHILKHCDMWPVR